MRTVSSIPNVGAGFIKSIFSVAALTALMIAFAPWARAQSVNFEPAALEKQRTEICLKATHTPITDLESDLNHLAVLSETCRAEYGAKACGVPETALESSKLEDRYAYYVRKPVEAHSSGRQAKIDRHNWEGKGAAAK